MKKILSSQLIKTKEEESEAVKIIEAINYQYLKERGLRFGLYHGVFMLILIYDQKKIDIYDVVANKPSSAIIIFWTQFINNERTAPMHAE